MTKKSQVFFIPVSYSDPLDTREKKLERLLRASGLTDIVRPRDRAVIKIHFGEEGNTGHVSPRLARVVAQDLLARSAQPVLSDTNTLYRGRRTNSQDHLKIAAEHGFTADQTGAEIEIPEDRDENVTAIPVNLKYIKTAKISRTYLQADALIGLAHFKGHLMTGFGGALKNIGMGCATREGKLSQHSDVAPIVSAGACVGCGTCVVACPVDAIALKKDKAVISSDVCIGCASCIATCPYQAIDVHWASGGDVIQEKMVEYAKAVLDAKKGKAAFLNFAVKITKECDCLAKDDPSIAPDLGFLASSDPVSVDKASYDLVVKACGRDIFLNEHPGRDGRKQLAYARDLGLGNLDYELITIAG